MPRVLIASDKFKGSLTAAGVAEAVGTGLRRVRPDVTVEAAPVADGGDGTVAAAVAAGFTSVDVVASGPTGDPVQTQYARQGDLAVVEMADVSGLTRVPSDRLAPMTATSRGTGEVIAAAVDAGCRRIVLGIGGSASTDGGAGLIRALGARLLDADGHEVAEGGGSLRAVTLVDLSALRERMAGVEVTVACDVDNPLTGASGAAAVYGPQKGATPSQIAELDDALRCWADVVAATTGEDHRTVPGAGAAGGVGFAAIALLGATLRSGIELVLELIGFDNRLDGVDLVVTGEGSLDEQTLHGKAVAGVAASARSHGVQAVAVCGRNLLDTGRLRDVGIAAAYALTDVEPDVTRCIARPTPLLELLGERIATEHLATRTPSGSEVNELDLVVRGRRVITEDGEAPAAVGVKDGAIVVVEALDADLPGAVVVELAEDEVLLPGVVDAHVHVNDPGRTEWEGFASATRAAAAGGVTTIVDMPLNSIPPTVDVPALELKRATAAPQAYVDVGFWGGAIPGNLPDLGPLHESGVFGFKCFLLHSGVEEFPPVDATQLAEAMREIATFDGLLIVHAEDGPSIEEAPNAHGPRYSDFLASRPRRSEDVAVQQVADLAAATGCRVHILHVSSADALTVIAKARSAGVRISAETCPHYLSFTAEEIPDGATQYKCCPPIREADNRDLLWAGLQDGTIGTVVSDHSPSTIDLKLLDEGDFGAAWGGISSLQLSLAAVWTEARARGFSLVDVVGWMCRGPADQVGLTRKGRIAVGCDADFVVLAPNASFVVDAEQLHHKNAITAYAGRELAGVVRSTWLRGTRIDIDSEPRGRLLRKGEA